MDNFRRQKWVKERYFVISKSKIAVKKEHNGATSPGAFYTLYSEFPQRGLRPQSFIILREMLWNNRWSEENDPRSHDPVQTSQELVIPSITLQRAALQQPARANKIQCPVTLHEYPIFHPYLLLAHCVIQRRRFDKHATPKILNTYLMQVLMLP